MSSETSQPFLWVTGKDSELEYQKLLGTGGGGAKVYQVIPDLQYVFNPTIASNFGGSSGTSAQAK